MKKILSNLISIKEEFKREIKKREVKRQIKFLVFITELTFFIFYIIWKNISYDVFKNTFQNFITTPNTLEYLYIGILSDVLFGFYYGLSIIYRKIIVRSSINIWLETTVLLIMLFSISGFYFLGGFMSHDLSSILRDSKNGTAYGVMFCTDNSGYFLVNSNVVCNVKQPDLHNFTINITFIFKNGTAFVETQNNNILFISPYDSKRIVFDLVGLDKTNNVVSLSTARDFEFYTENQYKERNSKFLTYLIGILTVIFIAIPSVMVNFKELCKKE